MMENDSTLSSLRRGIRRGSLLFLSFGFALLFLTATSARAQYILQVTGNTDGAGTCASPPGSNTTCTTLRAAINQANTDNANDTIEFNSTAYGTIALGSTLPAITGAMTIEGPAVTLPSTTEVAISGPGPNGNGNGNGPFRIMQVNLGATLTLKYLTLENGYLNTNASPYGGAIHNQGHLTVDTCWFRGNVALYVPYPGADEGNGGAIWNQSVGKTGSPATADIKNSLFSNNTAGFDGGAIWNSSGGLTNDTAMLNVTGSTFSNNISETIGGAISNAYGELTITDSSFNSNHAYVWGGAIDNYNHGITEIYSGSSFSQNYAKNGLGGAIYNQKATLTITGSTFTGNYAEKVDPGTNSFIHTLGGAIYNERATLTVTESTFDSNIARPVGTSLSEGLGGAIYSLGWTTIASYSPVALTTVTKSTFLNNQAVRGGAIYDDSKSFTNKVTGLTFATNDTFWDNVATGNSAGSQGGGGAIYTHSHYSSLYATNDTFSGNSAANGGGIMAANTGAANVNIKSSILAAEPGGNCHTSKATITDNGYNISDDTTCNFTPSSNNVSPVGFAGGLANNGGPTETVALQPSSPAVDAIPYSTTLADNYCTDQGSWQGATTVATPLAPPAPIAKDQRGVLRPQGPAGVQPQDLKCDIGAYELETDNSLPNINIASPAPLPTTYTINQQVKADYTCSDPDSEETGDTPTCTGTESTASGLTETIASGDNIDMSSVGTNTFAVTAKDNDSPNSQWTKTVYFTVEYGICSLNNTGISVVSGAGVPIKLQLCDANGKNLSSPDITVHATGVYLVPSGPMSDVQNAGNSNPGGDFRYSAALGGGTGGYIYNFMTTNYTAGTYELDFTVEGDTTTTYYVEFQVTN